MTTPVSEPSENSAATEPVDDGTPASVGQFVGDIVLDWFQRGVALAGFLIAIGIGTSGVESRKVLAVPAILLGVGVFVPMFLRWSRARRWVATLVLAALLGLTAWYGLSG